MMLTPQKQKALLRKKDASFLGGLLTSPASGWPSYWNHGQDRPCGYDNEQRAVVTRFVNLLYSPGEDSSLGLWGFHVEFPNGSTKLLNAFV